jgi:hypothetical protein
VALDQEPDVREILLLADELRLDEVLAVLCVQGALQEVRWQGRRQWGTAVAVVVAVNCCGDGSGSCTAMVLEAQLLRLRFLLGQPWHACSSCRRIAPLVASLLHSCWLAHPQHCRSWILLPPPAADWGGVRCCRRRHLF